MKPASLTRESARVLKPHLLLVIVATGLGITGGLCVTALLATINRASAGVTAVDAQLGIEFVLLCTLILACNVISNLCIAYVGQRVLARMRCELAERILTAPIDQLERYGSHKLIPVLVHDTGVLSGFVLSVAPLVVATTVTLGGIVYLTMLSWKLMLLMVAATLLGIGVQWLARERGMHGVVAARDGEDRLQKHYEAISEGAKELRIQRQRRHRILSDGIESAAEQIWRGNVLAARYFVSAESFGSMLFFAVIGIAIVLSSQGQLANTMMLGGFILVMLYLKGPLEHLANALPLFANAQVSLQRINQLAQQFAATEASLLDTAERPAAPALRNIELRDVRYSFAAAEGARTFTLGPVSLTIEQGDIVFIVGENGSGKTTLIKLLLGLYEPQSGTVLLNGVAVNAQSTDDYRQLFTTVFADYFLFDDLPHAGHTMPASAQTLLKRLELSHKVDIRGGTFSTTALSTGQRKRLALVNAWLDKRPVLLFDEWAADQDPSFRRIFYTELLPELKRLGKTLIVISHDDRYFDIADQLLRMESGRISVERREPLAEAVG